MVAVAVALWNGVIPVDWFASLGYKGIFALSLINGVAPVAGPSQIVTFFAARKLSPLGVGLAAGIGGAIGELATYAFGYTFRGAQTPEGEKRIQQLAKSRFLRVSSEHSFFPLFILAGFPNPLFKPACAVAGSLEIGIWRYFVPVLLAKTIRHVVIAYVGFYSISLHLRSLATGTTMTILIGSLPLIGAVVLIALAAWLVRTFAESDPDPLILNFTFFAFAGQCILTRELLTVINPGWVFGFLLVALILVLLQVLTLQGQHAVTLEHYKTVLKASKTDNCTQADIEHWAAALVRITGVDFYPEFYSRSGQGLSSGPRGRRRQEALLVLPESLFKHGEGGVTSTALTVPEDSRKWRWRAYAGICLASWLVFICCILIMRIDK